ncbi:MAG: caspase family protein [Deltaproteobacteria bacterium]|nr:caspase family protein [Deltaproteobacteria bacterium]
MKTFAAILINIVIVLLVSPNINANELPQGLRRFALIVGVNDGGPERSLLRYAASDAKTIARVLNELGGITEKDTTILLDIDNETLINTLEQYVSYIKSAQLPSQRIELVFYYSGHSDDQGLLLKGKRVGYRELRQALNKIPADVRVAIVDSCSSGALTRRKGGVHRPPFLIDGTTSVRGHAILTSSSEHEAAQESDRIRASYFTHYLISGLRGAADTTADGRVTLNEAYQFAFAETLHQTEKTQAGAQHPAYDIQLQGSGDLVMTDLRTTNASLSMAAELHGRFYIHDNSQHLAAELYKPIGRVVELGLEPGKYSVRLTQRDALYEAEVELQDGKHLLLKNNDLKKVSYELTAMRGKNNDINDFAAPEFAMPAEKNKNVSIDSFPRVNTSFSLIPTISTTETMVTKRLSLSLAMSESAYIDGADIGAGFNHVLYDLRGLQAGLVNKVDGAAVGAQVSYGVNLVNKQMFGLQGAAAFNSSNGGSFAQIAGGGNSTTAASRGLQTAGVFNIANSSFKGAQISGGFNVVKEDFTGAQITGILNQSSAYMTGVQIGLINLGGTKLTGSQIGLINISDDLSGGQIGLVNIGDKVNGTQIGLVNVSDNADAPIGFINYVKDVPLHFEFWGSSDEPTMFALRYGGKYIYAMFVTGIMRRNLPRMTNEDWSIGFGIGGHIPIQQAFIDIDIMGTSPASKFGHPDDHTTLGHLRLTVGWQIMPRLALFAGPMANVSIIADDKSLNLPVRDRFRSLEKVWHSGDTTVRLWPGFVIGVRI